MKARKHLLLLCCIAGFSAQAQYYNKTYHVNAVTPDPPVNYIATDLVTGYVNGYSVMLSRANDPAATNNHIVLTKFDGNGNIVFERKWDIDDPSMNDITITPDRLVFTPDNGHIVVGYIRRATAGKINPFAARFDVNGGLMWAKEYESFNDGWADPGRDPSASIVRMDYDDYIIVANSKPYWPNNYTYYRQDASIQVLRIDGADGTPRWNNKYELVNGGGLNERGTLPGSVYSFLTNMPRTVVNCDNSQVFIAGAVDNGPHGGLAYNNFYMSLNPDGTVAEKYKLNQRSYRSSHEKAFWDPNNNTVSLSYTTGNASLVSAPWTVSEVMAILRFNPVPGGGVDPYPPGPAVPVDYYYDAGGTQGNYVVGHCMTPIRDRYVFACWLSNSEVSWLGVKNHMALFDVDRVTMNTITNAHKFNLLRASQPTTGPVFLSDSPMVARRYAMAGNINYGAGVTGDKDIRVISANSAMVTCGDANLTILHENSTVDVQELNYLPNRIVSTVEDLSFTEKEYSTTSTNCLNSTDAATYKQAATTAYEQGEQPLVFPSLLAAGENRLNISLNAEAETSLELTVSGVDGKVLLRRSLPVVKGRQTLNCGLTELCPGNYLVHLESRDHKINMNSKFTRM